MAAARGRRSKQGEGKRWSEEEEMRPSSRRALSDIKNKQVRSRVFKERSAEKARAKLRQRIARKKAETSNPALLAERLRQNVPRTIDNTREHQHDMVTCGGSLAKIKANPAAPAAASKAKNEGEEAEDAEEEEVAKRAAADAEAEAEILADEENDPFAAYFKGDREPKVCVTTTKRPSALLHGFACAFASMLPTSLVRNRQMFDIKDIIQFCIKRDFTDLIVIGEDRRHGGPHCMTFVHLPHGPTAHFKLSNLRMSKEIADHGRASGHYPELILNNFNTRLGRTVGRFFATLFPPSPEYIGRQVVTVHNQRDFLFWRRHRYAFEMEEKEHLEEDDDEDQDHKKSAKKRNEAETPQVGLQELGPRFTLKLRWLQRGTYDTRNGEYEWNFSQKMETSRKRFFL